MGDSQNLIAQRSRHEMASNMDSQTLAAHRARIEMTDIGAEEEMYFIGSQMYVPRLVQANIKIPKDMGRYKLSQRQGKSLRTLGDDTYAPSGVQLQGKDIARERVLQERSKGLREGLPSPQEAVKQAAWNSLEEAARIRQG